MEKTLVTDHRIQGMLSPFVGVVGIQLGSKSGRIVPRFGEYGIHMGLLVNHASVFIIGGHGLLELLPVSKGVARSDSGGEGQTLHGSKIQLSLAVEFVVVVMIVSTVYHRCIIVAAIFYVGPVAVLPSHRVNARHPVCLGETA